MNNWRDKLYRFMQGRYGRIDELGRFLMYLLFGLLFVSFFVRSSIFSLLILLVFFPKISLRDTRKISIISRHVKK